MNARVTQSDIARVAGVHNTTVSLALRNSPVIPEATRKRIQSIAEQMGYCPDPALQALVAYRNGRMPNRRQQTLAYVTNWESKWGWREIPSHARCYLAAQNKAAQLGFQLEHFWLGEPGMSERRLSNMLFHRGITGMILASHRRDVESLGGVDWSRFSAVQIGCDPRAPGLHRVMYHHTGAIRLALKRILAAGYRRVGMIVPSGWNASADQAWSAGFFGEQSRLPASDRVPVLLYAPSQSCSLGPAAAGDHPVAASVLEDWISRYRPEVIVSVASFVLGQLKALGLSVPQDVAYVDLQLDDAGSGLSGVRENSERVGEVAIEVLVGHLQQNLCGVPAIATTTLVDGTWREGETLPRASRSDWNVEPRRSETHEPGQLTSVP